MSSTSRAGLAVGLAAVAVSLCSCGQTVRMHTGPMPEGGVNVEKASFGTTPDGQQADLYTLTNKNGMRVDITNYGGIVVRLFAPDKNGEMADIVLGYDKLADYIKDTPYFGALVGRYGNRIAKGKFSLDGKEYTLVQNNMGNHLHGGTKGFDKVIWTAEPSTTDTAACLKLTYLSKDGEEGYPGNLQCAVVYALTNNNELKIDYLATTDAATPINLTHHTYWNLAGHDSGDILSHKVMINADRYTPTDETLIPTGELAPVKGTPFDFTTATPIGKRIDGDHVQLERAGGYDHNFVLNKHKPGELTLAARVTEPTTGRAMEVLTTEPGMQFYAGNFLDGSNVGKGGAVYNFRNGFCMETQHFPDSPNQPNFPSVILKPGETYTHECIYRFGTVE